jgi:PKD repeat protein
MNAATFAVSVDGGTPVQGTVGGPFLQGVTYTRVLPVTVDLSGTTANVVKVEHAGGDIDASDNSAMTTVPYWPNPVSSFTQADSCLGDNMSFTNTSTITSGSITSTDWKFGDGNTSTTTSPTHMYASSGTYNVTISSTSNHGCKDTVVRSVNVLTELMAGSITGDSSICYNTASGMISEVTGASGSAGTYQYQWQSSANNSTWANVSGATSASYSPGVLTSTTYFRRAVTTDVGCGPSYTSSVKVTVYDDVAAGTIGTNQTICYNTTPSSIGQTTTPTGGDGTWTYQWEESTNGTTWANVAGATTTTYAPGALKTTTYYRLVATGGKSCGTVTSNMVTITVYDDLTAGVVGNDHSVCPQSPADAITQTVAPTGGDGTYTYQWQESTDRITWTNVSGATSADFNSTTGITVRTYYRRNTTSGSGCGTVATNDVNVSIAPLPVSSFIVANHCFNDVMPVTNNSSVATGSLTGFLWDFGDSNTSTARIPAHIYSSSGLKTVKLKVTTNIGCVDSSTNVVNVSNVPTPAFSTVYDCDAESMRFKNATSVNCGKISAFYWEFGDGTTSTLQNPTHKYTSSGTYSVKFKIFLPGGFEDSTTRSIVIADRAGSDFTADDECFGDSVRFVNSSTNATAYLWDFDDNNTSSLENPVHFYRVVGTYDVQLVAVDGNGCNDTTVKAVTVKVKPSVYFTGDDRCVDESVPFINGTLYAHSYVWTFGDGTSSTSSATTFNKAYSNDGTFTTKLVAYNNNGCRDSFSSNIVVHPNPVAGFTISDMCSDDAVNVTNTSTGHLTNHWDMGDMSTFTSTLPPSSFRYKAGTYTVTLTVASVHGCENVARNSVTVYDTPDADFSAPDVCEGTATVFTNNSTGGSGTVTYSWDFGDGNTSSAMSPSHTYAAAGTYQAKLTVTGQGSCTSTTTETVTVWATPTASVSVADVCVGGTSVFVGTTTGASTYAWDFGDGNKSTSQSPTHTYANAGKYTVKLTVTSINGCEVTATTSAVVHDLPVTSFTASTECLGNATSFTNNTTVGSGILTYTWNFGDGNTAGVISPTHTYATAGTYTVELTATANGCSKSYSTSVTVNDKPKADFVATDVCIGDVTTFTNYTGGASSYDWKFGDGNTSGVHSPTHTYASSGSFSVVLTAMNASGCTDAMTKTVQVHAKQTASFSVNNVCEDVAASFTNTSGSGTYLWSFGDGGVSTLSNPTYTYKNDGAYTVTLRVTSANGCESSTSNPITVYDAPTAGFADVTPCQNEAFTFTNTSTGASSYTWNFGDGSTPSTDENPTYTYTSPGSYRVQLEASTSNGCNDFVQRTITVSALPTVSFTAADACEGSSVQFTNFSSQGANTWTFGDGSGSRLTNPAHLYASTGSYPVNLSVTTAEGCTNAMTQTVNVNPNPVASFTANALCTGTNVDLTNNSTISSGSIISSTWNYGDGNVGTAKSHSYSAPGVYRITVTVTSDKGCVSTTTSPVAVYNAPTADFSAGDVCLGQSVVFVNQSSNASSNNWAFGDGGTSAVLNPTHMYSSAGGFSVTLNTENPLGCSAQVTKTVNVNANPGVSFNAPNGCDNADIRFTNTSTGGVSNVWDFGDGSSSSDVSPSHMYGSSGNKVVTLTVLTNKGCAGQASKTITVNTSPTAAFTAIGTCEGDETQFVNTSQNGNNFAWSFGDGNTSTNANPTNTYSTIGDFRALLIVSNANCVDSVEQSVSISALPNSGFTFTTSGREVTFTPSVTGQTVYAWNFGDGNSSTDEAPVHRYAGAVNETFKACLSLTDNNGCMSETCNDVTIDLVSVDNLDQANGLHIYPNPNKGNFVIVLDAIHGDIEIDLYDARGVHVSTIDASKPALKYNVDVEGVAEGVYFVRLKNGTYTSTQRMVITR